MTKTFSGSGGSWSRRTMLSVGAVAGTSALVGGGLTACSSGGAEESNKKVKSKIENPSDNLHKKGFPIVDDPVTIHFMTGRSPNAAKDYNKVASWEKYQKMTNVKIDWGLIPNDDKEEKRNLALSGGDYPEAFHTGGFGVRDVGKYGRQGVFIKLNDLIDQYMPNLKKLIDDNKDFKRGLTFPDDAIYGMPNIHDPDFLGLRIQYKLWARTDWLDKFDMDMPKTTDEFYRYLKAVKSKKPNGKSDAIGYAEAGELDKLRNALLGAFGIGNRGVTQPYLDADPDDKDKLRFYRTTDEYKALVEYVHRLYKEGLIAKNSFSIDPAKFQNSIKKGVYGSTVDLAMNARYGGEAKHFEAVPSLKGPDGENTWNYIYTPLKGVGNFVITDNNDHPVETARWMDYFYSDDGSKLFFMGVEGKSYKETKHGVEYLDKITDNPKGLTQDEALKPYVTYMGGGYPGIVKEDYFKGVEGSDESTKAAKKLKPDEQSEIWPHFTFTEDEQQKLDSVGDDIEKYVTESWANFVTGKTPLSKWKKYVDKIKQMGLDDYMEVQQAAYDRFRKN